jgi:hypothetical protein
MAQSEITESGRRAPNLSVGSDFPACGTHPRAERRVFGRESRDVRKLPRVVQDVVLLQ